jgi:hypothetical protein
MLRLLIDGKPVSVQREIVVTVELEATDGPRQSAQIKIDHTGITMDTLVVSNDGETVVASQSTLWDEFDIGID